MPRKGLMIDYEYCSGCHSCEVACKQEHGYPVGKGGIHLNEILTEMPDKRIRIDYIPFPTAYCDLCAARTRKGETAGLRQTLPGIRDVLRHGSRAGQDYG